MQQSRGEVGGPVSVQCGCICDAQHHLCIVMNNNNPYMTCFMIAMLTPQGALTAIRRQKWYTKIQYLFRCSPNICHSHNVATVPPNHLVVLHDQCNSGGKSCNKQTNMTIKQKMQLKLKCIKTETPFANVYRRPFSNKTALGTALQCMRITLALRRVPTSACRIHLFISIWSLHFLWDTWSFQNLS